MNTKGFEELVNCLKQNNIVFFVGAGLSKTIGAPNWNDLVREFLVKIKRKYPNDDEISILIDKSQNSPPLDLLSQLEKKYKRDCLLIMHEILSGIKIENAIFHELILQITDQIVTTNYDLVFENVIKKLGLTQIKKAIQDELKQITQLDYNQGFYFKIHGCISRPESCILFDSQYQNLYNFKSGTLYKFFPLLQEKTLVFIGFSFTDPFFKKLLNLNKTVYKTYQKKHFIISTSEMNLEEYGLETILIKNYKNDLKKVLRSLSKIRKEFPFMVSSYINSMRRLGKFIEEEKAKKIYKSFSRFRKLYDNELDFSYNIKNYGAGLKKLTLALDSLNAKYLLDQDNDRLRVEISKLHFEFYYFFRMHSKHTEALSNIKSAIKFAEEKDIVKYKVELADLLLHIDDNLEVIKILHPLKESDEAIEFYRDIFSILGFAYFRTNQIEECIEIRLHLLKIIENNGKLTEIVLARINLSMALLAKNLITEARDTLKNKNVDSFIRRTTKNISKNEALVFKLYFVAMGEILHKQKDYKLARKNLHTAIRIGVFYEVASLDSNYLFISLARIEFEEGNYEMAKKIFDDQYKYYVEMVGQNHRLTLESMFGIVDSLMRMSKYNNALDILKDMLKKIEANKGSNSLLYARCLGRMGKCYHDNEEYSEAIKNYDKANRIFDFYKSISIGDLIANHLNKSQSYFSLKNSKCIEEYEKAIALTLDNSNELTESLAQLYFGLSFHLQFFGQMDEGLMYVNQAINIITEIRKSDYFRNAVSKDINKHWGKVPMLFDVYSSRYKN